MEVINIPKLNWTDEQKSVVFGIDYELMMKGYTDIGDINLELCNDMSLADSEALLATENLISIDMEDK